MRDIQQKIDLRREFIKACSLTTKVIHEPIVGLEKTRGHLNPSGLGNAEEFSRGSYGQSTVAFETTEDYHAADDSGHSPRYDSAEYGIVRTPEAAAVCEKFARLHGGCGAVILPSGLSAISTVFSTFLKSGDGKPAVLIPDNRYFPAERVLNNLSEFNPSLSVYRYSADAGAQEIKDILKQVESDGRKVNMIYLEAPGSQTFEIPDLEGIVAVAKENNILTVMDNTWASHVRFKPLENGIDVVIQATTKYEGGYGDTPSGIVVAREKKDYDSLSRTVRAMGTGAVSPQTCNRLFYRVDTTEERMDLQNNSALKVSEWLQRKDFVDKILCPFLPESPDHERFKTYFKKGNGLLTIVFKKAANPATVNEFMDRLLLFRVGESWGGHVSLVLLADPSRTLSTLPEGKMVRLSIGLEDADDLIRDLSQASAAFHPAVP